MTRDEILAMEPGPEMDALVAEKVMGAKEPGWYGPIDRSGLHLHYQRYPTRQAAHEAYARYWDSPKTGYCNWLREGKTPEDIDLCSWRDGWGPVFVGNFSTDITAAMEALGRFRSWKISRISPTTHMNDCGDFEDSGLAKNANRTGHLHAVRLGRSAYVYSPSIPEAICKAALLAVGQKA